MADETMLRLKWRICRTIGRHFGLLVEGIGYEC